MNTHTVSTIALVAAPAPLLTALLASASAGNRELQGQQRSASGQVAALQPRLELARLRVIQNRELVATGAGDRFALEQAEANVLDLQAQLLQLDQLGDRLSAMVGLKAADLRRTSPERGGRGGPLVVPAVPDTATALGVEVDRLIEAVEAQEHPFGLAVQWHPEWLQAHLVMRSLFERFVQAAA